MKRNWIEYARQKAVFVDAPGKYRIFALALDRRGKILATGVNSYVKTHPKQHEYAKRTNNPGRYYLHAEICALVRAKREVHTLVVVRVTKRGELRPAKPCKICELAIKEANVQQVIHS